MAPFAGAAAPLAAAEQPEQATAAAADSAHHEEEGNAGGAWPRSRASSTSRSSWASLVYLLRSPFANYLRDRSTGSGADLVKAAAMKQEAAALIEDIDRKMKALPGELETLRIVGAQEIAAEEQRILTAAAAGARSAARQARRRSISRSRWPSATS